MARIIAPDDTGFDDVIRGTQGNDQIIGQGRGTFLGLHGNDDINPGITSLRSEIVMAFGGAGWHDARKLPFKLGGPYYGSGADTIHIGRWIWGDGEDGKDTYVSHGPSSFGKAMPRAWMDWREDVLIFDNSDKSHDTRGGYRADGSGVKNGFEVVNIHFARTFESDAGYHYAEVNGFTVHSFSKSDLIREQATDLLFYDKGDARGHHKLFVAYDPEHETARQAVAEFAHAHAVAGADQFLF